MLIKTGGIVIKNTKYSDSSVITKIYTRALGVQSYMIHGIRSPKANIKPSLLQPLTLLDLVVYSNPIKNIQRIKEARPHPPLQNFHFDVVKSTIGLFVAELLHRTIKEEEPNVQLYDFVEKFIVYSDDAEENISVLPLFFTLQLTRFLGFFPQRDVMNEDLAFNIADGIFTEMSDAGTNSIPPTHAFHLQRLMMAGFNDLAQTKIPKASRQLLLQKLMDYCAIHIPGFFSLKSLPVLASLLKED